MIMLIGPREPGGRGKRLRHTQMDWSQEPRDSRDQGCSVSAIRLPCSRYSAALFTLFSGATSDRHQPRRVAAAAAGPLNSASRYLVRRRWLTLPRSKPRRATTYSAWHSGRRFGGGGSGLRGAGCLVEVGPRLGSDRVAADGDAQCGGCHGVGRAVVCNDERVGAGLFGRHDQLWLRRSPAHRGTRRPVGGRTDRNPRGLGRSEDDRSIGPGAARGGIDVAGNVERGAKRWAQPPPAAADCEQRRDRCTGDRRAQSGCC